MTAHGADPDTVDHETFNDICIMYADGMIGNIGVIQLLASHTAGHFNMVLPKGKQPYKIKDIIPNQYDYLYPPQTEQDSKKAVNDALLNFVKTKPNAPKKLFKG